MKAKTENSKVDMNAVIENQREVVLSLQSQIQRLSEVKK